MKSLTVTVITISFRNLQGLIRTRQSVESQVGSSRIEHIIVDGGSNDGTVDYLQSLPPSVIWRSEPDQGIYDAMNKGVQAASGDLLWFMNSGDVFSTSSAIELAVGAFDGDVAELRHGWGYGLARKAVAPRNYVGIFGDVPFSLRRFGLGGHPIPHQAAFFGSNMVTAVGGYSLEHGLAADQLFMLRCATMASPRVIVDFLCDFDVSGVGSKRSVHAHYRDMRRSRRLVGYTATRSRLLDETLSLASEAKSTLARLTASARRG